MSERKECPECLGSGVVNVNQKCENCDGTGHVVALDEIPPPPDGPGGQTGQ